MIWRCRMQTLEEDSIGKSSHESGGSPERNASNPGSPGLALLCRFLPWADWRLGERWRESRTRVEKRGWPITLACHCTRRSRICQHHHAGPDVVKGARKENNCQVVRPVKKFQSHLLVLPALALQLQSACL